MTPWLLPLLPLLLLGSTPAVQPAPPTCYSRMLSLSREIMGDFQSLQATEPSVSPPCLLRSSKFNADLVPTKVPLHQEKKNAIFLFWSMLISRAFVL